MGEASSLVNLILLAVAVVVFLKLRSVLGRRTGDERQPYDPFSRDETGAPSADNDKVVHLPRARRPQADEDHTDFDAAPGAAKDRWAGLVPQGSPIAQTLTEIALADRYFDAREFVTGAKAAYEMIVTAFAKGERETLKPLLETHVYKSFEAVIADRQSRGETIEQTFIGITKTDLHAAELVGQRARITLRFVSELTACTKNTDGVVIEGDPVTIRKVTDIWTFERDVTANDPNWRLVATGSED